jgi:hypothetical protein
MTTWAATHYVPRLLEVAGLADVVIYVASDERYNDEVPTQFLKLLLQAGKAVVVVLVKMKEQDAPTFVQHFQKEVLAKMPVQAVSCLTIPQLSAAQLADPVKQAANYRIPLLNQVDVLGKPVTAARQRSVRSAVHFLKLGQETLLSVARADLAALNTWCNLVQEGRADFEERYRREYLSAEQFHRFDEALVRLLELLELPGVGKVLSTALYIMRTPYRLLKGLFTRSFRRPPAPTLPERPILDAALGGWLDLLRKETARRAATHPLWAHIHRGFASGLADQAGQRFEQGFRTFQLSQADEVERTARAIYEDLERHPAALNTLRGTKFALEVGAIAGSVVTVGLWGLVVGPLAASITHQLVELLGSQYVDTRREQARTRQQALVAQHMASPMAEWLTNWPSTGGSAFERLQLALRRVPQDIQQLERAVQERKRD